MAESALTFEMSERMRRIFQLIGIWVTTLLAVCITYYRIYDAIYLFTSYAIIGLSFLGLILAIYSLKALFKERNKKPPIIALILTISLSIFFVVSDKWIHFGNIARFYIEKSGYEATIAKVMDRNDDKEREKLCSGKCKIENGSDGNPRQLVFPWTSMDVLIGWLGVVYDPTGEIIKAPWLMRENPNIDVNSPVAKRTFFGCSVLNVEHLSGNWYLVHFWHD